MKYQRTYQVTVRPIGFSPTGEPLVFHRELPALGMPRKFVVLREAFEIDGWLFPYEFLTKGVLEWLRERFIAWRAEDLSDENLEWLEAMLGTLQDALCESFAAREAQ